MIQTYLRMFNQNNKKKTQNDFHHLIYFKRFDVCLYWFTNLYFIFLWTFISNRSLATWFLLKSTISYKCIWSMMAVIVIEKGVLILFFLYLLPINFDDDNDDETCYSLSFSSLLSFIIIDIINVIVGRLIDWLIAQLSPQ